MDEISRRKEMEETLRESETVIKSTLDNFPVGVAINSVDPKVHFMVLADVAMPQMGGKEMVQELKRIIPVLRCCTCPLLRCGTY